MSKLYNSIKSLQTIATVANATDPLSTQRLLNSIVQHFIPLPAPTVAKSSSVWKLYSTINGQVNTASAVNAIDSSALQTQNANTCSHQFMQHSFTAAIVTHALRQHLANKVHKPRTKPEVSSLRLSNWVCEECDRDFRNVKDLNQHRSSVVHNPLSNINCNANGNCKKRFSSPSAWLHHLESGTCPSRINRGKLHQAIQLNDTNHLISSSSFQEHAAFMEVDWSEKMSATESVIFTPVTDDSFGEFPSPFATPESQSGMLTPSSGRSQHMSENLSLAVRLSCPLCPIGRKPFKSLTAMKDHLESPAHSPRIFHCPLNLAGFGDEGEVSQLMKHFSTLSGLMQHLESGACQGGRATFRKTAEYIEHNLGKMGLQKMRLLN
ncbi:MAG: hypothetical protein Q9217_000591 [Psora testacea]